jgi:prophage regulatory protein
MVDTALLRLETVVSRRGRSRAQLYVDIKRGTMTPPVRLGEKLSAWPSSEIDALNRAEIGGATPDELRALVKELVALRAQMKPKPGAQPGGRRAA